MSYKFYFRLSPLQAEKGLSLENGEDEVLIDVALLRPTF